MIMLRLLPQSFELFSLAHPPRSGLSSSVSHKQLLTSIDRPQVFPLEGTTDSSTAVALENGHLLVGDDEVNYLFLLRRSDGKLLHKFDVGHQLKEVRRARWSLFFPACRIRRLSDCNAVIKTTEGV
eukprot:TRINITY_DN6075_c0_g1_i1.p1 TRINITY_DN6075_c0_g1~~TRINITY_DN6075_c0_g1_i1.p1  ORF type:complete len:126 (+),score=1.21 TRINITY_DN6075_c0_g1_i1:163-540(+)